MSIEECCYTKKVARRPRGGDAIPDISAVMPMPEEMLRLLRAGREPRGGQSSGFIGPRDLHGVAREGDAGPMRHAWLAQTGAPRARAAAAEMTASRLRDLSSIALPPAGAMRLMRQELLDAGYPWCTVGRVFVGINEDYVNWTQSGTGVLIGHNIILTASHVAPWDQASWWMRFVPAYRDGAAPLGQSYVQQFRGYKNSDEIKGSDYIVAKLYNPLGDALGWMGTHSFGDEDNYKDVPWQSIGYPGDFFMAQRPALQPFVAVEDIDDDDGGLELETTPFTSNGWSGGPLFGWPRGVTGPRVAGVCSGREEEFSFWDFFTATHSVFAGGSQMVDLVKWAMANWG
ncbi:hypothetical protein Msil_3704 [Methylocella silvestris BL2]|uniref:Serine protease n=1 Tax=Methylocella silvestris (strain DSM 15510 / CIP 108128 / LMG 27833 / NCIMB 13906 / BL2) TaxID=395965 RepID=B8EJ96_METSB|nr:hypothetical protein [Methylocella silvestris]ACK52588.1 hypothetical protein Msil_3704 [Methylocella silvestris BL2]